VAREQMTERGDTLRALRVSGLAPPQRKVKTKA
jgi:hypothetical protein